MNDSDNKAYKFFLTYFTDSEFASAWLRKNRVHMEVGVDALYNDGYQHRVWVKVSGKFTSLDSMPSNISITGNPKDSEEQVLVQWFTENPEWTWENQVEPAHTFHRKDKTWTRKI